MLLAMLIHNVTGGETTNTSSIAQENADDFQYKYHMNRDSGNHMH